MVITSQNIIKRERLLYRFFIDRKLQIVSYMKKKVFKIDLTKIEGDGDFPCPKCNTRISPDDETETVYTVIDAIIGEDDTVENLVIKCNKCESVISLEGFEALSEEVESKVKVSEALPTSKAGLQTNHTIEMDGKEIGSLAVEYAQKDDVDAFKKFRNLSVGAPFKATVAIKGVEGSELPKEDLREIVKVAKRRIKGLKDRDIYLVEVKDGDKKLIGKASDLVEEPLQA